MKLSILIPIYNWDIQLLVSSLVEEINEARLCNSIEIILIDDCSSEKSIRESNEFFINRINAHCIKYYPLESNVGRSMVRKFLVQKANGLYMLFLDADTLPDSKTFIMNYLDIINSTPTFKIVLGGLSYLQRIKNEKECDFYYYMGKKIGEISADIRLENPWKYVVTSNLLISADIIDNTPIDTSFIGYGFEDTEWGIRLMKNFQILHIDNTVSHLGLENKSNLVKKIIESSENYNRLVDKHDKFLTNWALRNYVDRLASFNINILSFLLQVSIHCFNLSRFNKLSLILFQVIKIVSFAKNKKDKNNIGEK